MGSDYGTLLDCYMEYLESVYENTKYKFFELFKCYRKLMNVNEESICSSRVFDKLGVKEEKNDYIILSLDSTGRVCSI